MPSWITTLLPLIGVLVGVIVGAVLNHLLQERTALRQHERQKELDRVADARTLRNAKMDRQQEACVSLLEAEQVILDVMNGILPFALEGETSEDIEARQGGNIFNLESVEDISKQSRRARAVLSSQPDTKAILLISDEMSVAVNKYMTLIQRHNTQPGSVPRSNIVAALAEVRDNYIKLENAIREHLANLQVAQ